MLIGFAVKDRDVNFGEKCFIGHKKGSSYQCWDSAPRIFKTFDGVKKSLVRNEDKNVILLVYLNIPDRDSYFDFNLGFEMIKMDEREKLWNMSTKEANEYINKKWR